MESSTKAVCNTTEVTDKATFSYTTTPQATPQLHLPTAQAPISPEPLPSYPARDCSKCPLAEEGLHTHECHRAIAATLQEYIQVSKNALLPDELNPENQSRQGKASADRFKTSGKDQIAVLVAESLQSGQHPASSLESFVKVSMAARVREAARLQQLDKNQAAADDLYDTMISHYHDSPGGHELFEQWRKAMEELLVCIVEKWELKREVEKMSVQAVEASERRLAATTEQLRERDGRTEREGKF